MLQTRCTQRCLPPCHPRHQPPTPPLLGTQGVLPAAARRPAAPQAARLAAAAAASPSPAVELRRAEPSQAVRGETVLQDATMRAMVRVRLQPWCVAERARGGCNAVEASEARMEARVDELQSAAVYRRAEWWSGRMRLLL